MTTTAHRITAWRLPRPALTCWWYGRESRWSTAFSTVLADGHGLPALADFAIAPARPHRAEEQAAAAFDRWPGLGIVAIPLGGGRCLLGERSGETALADGVPADLAALAAHLWLTTGRRLGTLETLHATETTTHPQPTNGQKPSPPETGTNPRPRPTTGPRLGAPETLHATETTTHPQPTTGRQQGALQPVRAAGRVEAELVVVCGAWRLDLARSARLRPQ
ncbi:hypothetical protein [Amycolatopsis sp. NPDC004169]|uniref:hypothetical protein n=1 Tax=Amycolatopsis sp. NPDC004169 TaxID=3154453 RepID=UPI0033AEE3B5